MGLKALVVGLGKSGMEAAILARRKGFDVVATDIKERKELEGVEALEKEGVTVSVGGHDKELFKNADLVIVSPGIPPREEFEIAEKSGAEVISEIEFASRFIKAKILGVTGTNGKSTVTTMLGAIIASSGKPNWTGGNLGTPFCLAVDSPANTEDGLIALELSSFQLERIKKFRPVVACILNITPDHLDRYKSFNDYAEAKFRIFMNQKKGDHLLIPSGVKWMQERCRFVEPDLHLVGDDKEGRIFFDGSKIHLMDLDGVWKEIDPGKYNLKDKLAINNAMFAILAGLLAGVGLERILNGLKNFQPLAHRFQLVAVINGVKWINDSKATNPDAMIKAIEAGEKNILLIAGGLGKGFEFDSVAEVCRGRVKYALLFGKSAQQIYKSLKGVVRAEVVENMEEAVQKASYLSQAGDCVLLAPGCASFDMFKNFEDRGDKFINLVRMLEKH